MTDLNEQETALSELLAGIPAEYSPGARHREELRAQMIAARARRRPGLFSPGRQPLLGRARRAMRRPVTRWIAVAAACIALAAIWFSLPGHPGASQALACCADAIVNARSVTYTQVQTIEGEEPVKSQVFSLPPDKMRVERANGNIDVYDYGGGKIKMLNLMPSTKTAWLTVAKQQPDEQESDFFETMRDLLAKGSNASSGNVPGIGRYDLKPIGEKEIDGRHVVGFRYTFADAASSITLWGDPATGEPVLIEAVMSGGGHRRIDLSLSHFKLNPDLDPKLFDITPPADYQVQTFADGGSRSQKVTPIEQPPAEDGDAAAKVEFFIGESQAAGGLKPMRVKIAGSEQPVYLHAEPIVTQADIAKAQAGLMDGGHVVIEVTFTQAGSEKMHAATAHNLGKWLVVVVDGEAVTAAKIYSPIAESAQITGSFSEAEAKQLAGDLSSRRRKTP